ncbi:hypothetical protein MPTK1_7g07310 [Marchantia polymorpha subsp. ruderalis]|uniref:Uncharacterized protein n=2 Tax=Marchantia polymorpha TaxID=3197 RepID=A0AAF6BX17_MARPO|nr:hypothetical protein MARPO_0076s0063 [Marchantia polymorpha]BBN16551.1 hypothetical protein Mp_7g07310 [Marchantia polymorpha subsp. ruderalis]|eukprot:PTQ34827.1 hypothetical protein MARPO_0076s0063 [Marchantia polymorpha]
MEQQGNNQEESNGTNALGRVKDNIKDKVQRVRSKLHPNHEADESNSEPHESSHSNVDRSNIEDFPYDGTCDDEFSIELASIADEQRDEIGSPMSQDSGRHSFNSTVSGVSWTSTQKTIAGLGMDEVGSQEVLGPYKRVGSVQALEAVPTEYRDYNNNRNRDDAHSAGNISYARSPSQSSTQSISSSLYNDLSSISDRDLQVPEGIIKADGFDCEFDKEISPSPSQSYGMEQDISKMRLNGST